MFKTALIFVGLLATGLASQCCVPSTWEGFQHKTAASIKNGVTTFSSINIKVHYDLTNNQAAFDESVTANGYTVNVTVIQKFKEGLEYVINGPSCVKKSIPTSPQTRCVPDNATLDSRHFIGLGQSKLPYNTFTYKTNTLSASISMTDKCIPVMQTVDGTVAGVKFLTTDSYSDITEGIVDTSVFNVPSICKTATLVQGGPSNLGVLGR